MAQLPGQPDDPHQPRPVLIISVDSRNRSTDDVIAIPIFTHGRLGPTRVRIHAGTGGIRQDSVMFCDELTTIGHDFLDHGPLGPPVAHDFLDRIVQAVLNAILP
jgi:mRNA-degrading endonuclease toxin of MazEF toxin-antitoxin module